MIKLISRTITVITVAKTGFDLYKKGKSMYDKYQSAKELKEKSTKTLKKLKRLLKKP